jgi:hypothetical protein
VSLSACSEQSAIQPLARLTPEHVTAAAAAALRSDGRFQLQASVVNPPGELSEQQARIFALRYVKAVGQFLRDSWSSSHGAVVDPAALIVCGDRAFHAVSPYASVTGDASEYITRVVGPQWIVPLCGQGGTLQVILSVSSLATELAANGPTLPYGRANAISFGFPKIANGSLLTPEGAAQYAFTQSGRRVSSVPELVANPRPEAPHLVRWRMDIEAPVELKGLVSGTSRARSTLLVGFGEIFKSSGMLDFNPSAATPLLSWMDPGTKSTVAAVLSPFAPTGVELVTRERP